MATEHSETTLYHYSVLPSPLLLHTSIQDSNSAKSGTKLYCSALRKREMYIALLIIGKSDKYHGLPFSAYQYQ